MSETTHTPGPWGIDRDPEDPQNVAIQSETNGYYVCDMSGHLLGGDREQAANAALIAAAPDLLEALRYAHDHLALDHEGPDGEPDWLLVKIRGAIAKAEGK